MKKNLIIISIFTIFLNCPSYADPNKNKDSESKCLSIYRSERVGKKYSRLMLYKPLSFSVELNKDFKNLSAIKRAPILALAGTLDVFSLPISVLFLLLFINDISI